VTIFPIKLLHNQQHPPLLEVTVGCTKICWLPKYPCCLQLQKTEARWKKICTLRSDLWHALDPSRSKSLPQLLLKVSDVVGEGHYQKSKAIFFKQSWQTKNRNNRLYLGIYTRRRKFMLNYTHAQIPSN
jgi:hypothetical protein